MDTKQRYFMIDVLKLLFAYAIIVHHIFLINDKQLIYLDAFIPVMVSFFFAISGFLLYKKIESNIENKKIIVISYAKRILILYLFWSATLFVFRIKDIIKIGFDIKGQAIYWLKYFRILLFIGEYQLWYLIGLLWILAIFYLLLKNNKLKLNVIVAIILWIMNYALNSIQGKSDNIAIEKIIYVYKIMGNTTRNGLFTGFLFFVIGCLVAKYHNRITNWLRVRIITVVLVIASAVAWVIIISEISFHVSLFFIEPVLVFSLLVLSISFKKRFDTTRIGSYSSIVFLGHMFFVILICNIMNGNNIGVQFAIDIVCITIIAIVLERISRKNKKFKYLY